MIYKESQKKPIKHVEAKSDLQVCVHVVTKILHEDIGDKRPRLDILNILQKPRLLPIEWWQKEFLVVWGYKVFFMTHHFRILKLGLLLIPQCGTPY